MSAPDFIEWAIALDAVAEQMEASPYPGVAAIAALVRQAEAKCNELDEQAA